MREADAEQKMREADAEQGYAMKDAALPSLTIRPGHPDFLDLPWQRSVVHWPAERLLTLPKGISRHEVRFVAYEGRHNAIYVVKELPEHAARREYDVLTRLAGERGKDALCVTPVGLVLHRHPDPTAEASAALITRYLDFSFSYRELLEGAGFGARRTQMLDAFAGLFVELHIAGCFWGDCSLSNVLYRFDAQAVDTIMVDAETAYLHQVLSDGQREEDLAIMIHNVAGDMADIAAAGGLPLDRADLWLGEDIAKRYRALWTELARVETIGPDEGHRVTERIRRLNDLGFSVKEIDLVPAPSGNTLRVTVKPGGRNHHSQQLRELTGIETSEWQARWLLSDLYYYQAKAGRPANAKAVAAIQWRVTVLEPTIARIAGIPGIIDAIQGYCDLLNHRYLKSVEAGLDVGTEAALENWLALGCPAYRP
jgi:Domain of unknown function (DUF4032)